MRGRAGEQRARVPHSNILGVLFRSETKKKNEKKKREKNKLEARRQPCTVLSYRIDHAISSSPTYPPLESRSILDPLDPTT